MLSRKMNRMGVTKRPNGSWRARVLGPDGRERASHHKTKAAALRSHDLRHTYCCWLLQAGVDVVTVAERMGHESAQMIWQTYGHVIPGQEDRTRRAIDAVWTENTDSIRTTRSRQGADQ